MSACQGLLFHLPLVVLFQNALHRVAVEPQAGLFIIAEMRIPERRRDGLHTAERLFRVAVGWAVGAHDDCRYHAIVCKSLAQ